MNIKQFLKQLSYICRYNGKILWQMLLILEELFAFIAKGPN